MVNSINKINYFRMIHSSWVLDITAKVYHHFSAKFTTDMDLL
jgi:hypothetical protein